MVTGGRQWLVGGLATVAVLAGLWAWRPPTSASVTWERDGGAAGLLAAGSAAPLFVLPAADGDSVRLADLRGSRTALLFVRPGCRHCERLLGELSGVAATPGRHIVVVSESSIDDAARLRREQGLEIPVLADSRGETGTAYAASAVPCGYLIDERGRIESSARGMPAARELVDEL